MTRTHSKWVRPYIDGYSWCGQTKSVGVLGTNYDAPNDSALCDNIKNIVLGQGTITVGAINAFFAPTGTSSGFHDYFNGGNSYSRNLLVGVGVNAEPTAGNPMFAWTLAQKNYQMNADGFVMASMEFDPSATGVVTYYSNGWGILLHGESAETAVNTATGVDDFGSATTKGGMFAYQILSSDGTVTVKAQDAATNSNGSFSDLSGATSGVVDATTTPVSGQIALSTTATVRRYLRWQIVLGTATTVTFVCGVVRNHI